MAGKMKGIAFIKDPDGYWIEIFDLKTIGNNTAGAAWVAAHKFQVVFKIFSLSALYLYKFLYKFNLASLMVKLSTWIKLV